MPPPAHHPESRICLEVLLEHRRRGVIGAEHLEVVHHDDPRPGARPAPRAARPPSRPPPSTVTRGRCARSRSGERRGASTTARHPRSSVSSSVASSAVERPDLGGPTTSRPGPSRSTSTPRGPSVSPPTPTSSSVGSAGPSRSAATCVAAHEHRELVDPPRSQRCGQAPDALGRPHRECLQRGDLGRPARVRVQQCDLHLRRHLARAERPTGRHARRHVLGPKPDVGDSPRARHPQQQAVLQRCARSGRRTTPGPRSPPRGGRPPLPHAAARRTAPGAPLRPAARRPRRSPPTDRACTTRYGSRSGAATAARCSRDVRPRPAASSCWRRVTSRAQQVRAAGAPGPPGRV